MHVEENQRETRNPFIHPQKKVTKRVFFVVRRLCARVDDCLDFHEGFEFDMHGFEELHCSTTDILVQFATHGGKEYVFDPDAWLVVISDQRRHHDKNDLRIVLEESYRNEFGGKIGIENFSKLYLAALTCY